MATGTLSLPMTHLATLLSNSAAFQAWVGAADAAAALLAIYYVDVDELTIARPFAIIDTGDKWHSKKRTEGGNVFVKRGELLLGFEALVDPTHTEAEAIIAFLDHVGGCVADMEAIAGTDGFLSIHEIEFDDEGPSRSLHDENPPPDDYYRIKFIVTWGI